MARNPRWCLSLPEWERVFAGWIDRGDPESLLAASIFFDFRPLWGRSRDGGGTAPRRRRAGRGQSPLPEADDGQRASQPAPAVVARRDRRDGVGRRRRGHRPQACRRHADQRRRAYSRARRGRDDHQHHRAAARGRARDAHCRGRRGELVRCLRLPAAAPPAHAVPAAPVTGSKSTPTPTSCPSRACRRSIGASCARRCVRCASCSSAWRSSIREPRAPSWRRLLPSRFREPDDAGVDDALGRPRHGDLGPRSRPGSPARHRGGGRGRAGNPHRRQLRVRASHRRCRHRLQCRRAWHRTRGAARRSSGRDRVAGVRGLPRRCAVHRLPCGLRPGGPDAGVQGGGGRTATGALARSGAFGGSPRPGARTRRRARPGRLAHDLLDRRGRSVTTRQRTPSQRRSSCCACARGPRSRARGALRPSNALPARVAGWRRGASQPSRRAASDAVSRRATARPCRLRRGRWRASSGVPIDSLMPLRGASMKSSDAPSRSECSDR